MTDLNDSLFLENNLNNNSCQGIINRNFAFSEVIKDVLYYGPYPDINDIKSMVNNGFKYFYDLTCGNDKLEYRYIDVENIDVENNENACTQNIFNIFYKNFKIKDRYFPEDWKEFSYLLIDIKNKIKDIKNRPFKPKIYIHCRGGHGRSGIVIACLLKIIYKISVEEALEKTNECHSKRPFLKDKWKILGSPQQHCQKIFVYRYFKNLYFYKYKNPDKMKGFSLYDNNNISTEFGIFPDIKCAYRAHLSKIINDFNLGDNMSENKKYLILKLKKKVMEKVISKKLKQYPLLLETLLNTGFRTIIYSDNDIYWGRNRENIGKNNLGKIYMKLRKKYYIKNSK